MSGGTPHLGTPLVNLLSLDCNVEFPGPENMLPGGEFIQMLLHHPADIANRSKYYAITGRMKGAWGWVNLVYTWTWAENYYPMRSPGIMAYINSL
jgi:hypothetical protein